MEPFCINDEPDSFYYTPVFYKIKPVLIVCRNQAGVEKQETTAKGRIGIGFNQVDAQIPTALAEKHPDEEPGTLSELELVRRLNAKS